METYISPFLLGVFPNVFVAIGNQTAALSKDYMAFDIPTLSIDEADTYIVIQKLSASEYLCIKIDEKIIPYEDSEFIITSLDNKNIYIINGITKMSQPKEELELPNKETKYIST